MAAILPIESLITKCELQQGTELVVNFVDFSSKYGLGYKLSNGAYGVLFNDSTKIITSANLFHFAYIERVKDNDNAEQIKEYDFFNYPSSIS